MDVLGQFLPPRDGKAKCEVRGEPDPPRCFWLLCRDTCHLRKLFLLPGPYLEEHVWPEARACVTDPETAASVGLAGSLVEGLLGACLRASALLGV